MLYARGLTIAIDGLQIVADVSFEVPRGSLAVLTGPNGSGKTTILRALCSDIRLAEGDCGIGERSSSHRDALRRSGCSALVDAQPVSRSLTVAEHLGLLRESWGIDPQDSGFSTPSVIEEFGLGGLEGRFPHQLSSGQQQGLQLAMALGRPASALLLDEPDRHLDAGRRAQLTDSLRKRCDAGAAALVASHGEEMIAAADQLLELA